MQIQPILGNFWAIFRLFQPPGPPFWISAPPFYISWIRPWFHVQAMEGQYLIMELSSIERFIFLGKSSV